MPGSTSRLAARTAELLTGFLTWKAMGWTFDYVAYPFAIWKLGVVYGGLLMLGVSLLMCLLQLRLYDIMGRDCLGIEFVKKQRHYAGSSRWRRGLARMIARGDWIAFAALSIIYDPFITTAYLRYGAYNGMTRRDWLVLINSCLVSNAFWVALSFGGISIVRAVI